jgi:hypothetical protein
MTLTDIAAWIGAATGSISLLWEIYKWAKSGPKVIVSINPNMVSEQGGHFVMISVRNTGDRNQVEALASVSPFAGVWAWPSRNSLPSGHPSRTTAHTEGILTR